MNLRDVEDRRSQVIHRRLMRGGYRIGPAPNGYTVTCHAVERMMARRIHMADVMDAMDVPGRPTRTGCTKHVGFRATVVVNHDLRCIVTVGYGAANQPRLAQAS